MTAPTFRADPTVLDELRRGDERAFERFFRNAYPGLVNEAKGELGEEAAAAGRVTEKVFSRVWAERASFTSPDQLDKFVHGTVHEAAVRERSRLGALHRLESNEKVKAGAAKHGEATVDEAWAHVQSAMHAGSAGAEAREQSRAHRSKDAAAHVNAISGKKGSWIVPAAVLVLTAVVATAGISFLARGGEEVVLSNAINGADAKVTTTSPGQTGIMTLDDGSKIKVAPNSRVKVPSKFLIGNIRGFRIDGAAQVTAAAGQPIPLEIRVGKFPISTPGGVIDVANDTIAGTAIVRLREGTATLRVGKEARPLTVGTAVALDSASTFSTPTPELVAERLGWADGKVTINARPLGDVIKQMKQWWGLEIYVPDAKLNDRLVTMTADLDSPKSAISAVEKGGGLTFGYEGKNMIFKDGKKK